MDNPETLVTLEIVVRHRTKKNKTKTTTQKIKKMSNNDPTGCESMCFRSISSSYFLYAF
jgi:hypothetical protein